MTGLIQWQHLIPPRQEIIRQYREALNEWLVAFHAHGRVYVLTDKMNTIIQVYTLYVPSANPRQATMLSSMPYGKLPNNLIKAERGALDAYLRGHLLYSTTTRGYTTKVVPLIIGAIHTFVDPEETRFDESHKCGFIQEDLNSVNRYQIKRGRDL